MGLVKSLVMPHLLIFLLFFAKLGKSAVWIRHEFLGGLVLEDFATAEEKNSIRVDNRVQTMGDRENRRFSKFFADKLLDCLLSHYVDVRRSLVKHNELASPQSCSDDAKKLTLANRQVLSFLLNKVLKVDVTVALI